MKTFAVGLALVLTIYSNAMAQNVAPECALDLRGTSRSNGMPDYVVTDSSGRARTLEDFRNAAVNYFFHNNNGIAARGLLVGTFASGFSEIAIPLCNNLGQCVTTRISPTFSGSVSVGGLISIGGDMVHTGYRIRVETWGGNIETRDTGLTHDVVLRIPASGPAGLIYQDQTCRFNDHLEQSPDENSGTSTTTGATPVGGSDGGSFGDADTGGGQQGYPGAIPASGGGGGTECWEFIARDQDGNFIGAYIVCY